MSDDDDDDELLIGTYAALRNDISNDLELLSELFNDKKQSLCDN